VIAFATLRDYTLELLEGEGIIDLPPFDVGPYDPDSAQRFPGRIVLMAPWSGGPMTTEKMFDNQGWMLDVLGEQNNFDDAYDMATAIDRIWNRVDSSQDVNGTWVNFINRAGGGPALVEHDVASRYRFNCSYIVQSASGI
jgi:hypothetical protein